MSDTQSLTAPSTAPPTPRRSSPVPGVLLCLVVAAGAYGLGLLLPNVSPLIIAIIVGMVLANIGGVPAWASPGVDFSAKKLLRLGIVVLGLKLALTDIAALGAPMLAVVVAIVAGGILGTVALGRLLKVPPHLALLIACGFSICGAAAVAGAAGITDPEEEHEEDTVTAVALVVIFGTLMIALVPLAASALGLDTIIAGTWAGGSIHEIAQVVAVGGILGGGALAIAVVVKLARVLMLAPVVAVLSVRQRRLSATADSTAQGKLPPIVPPFIIGFLAMVLIRTFVPLPEVVLEIGNITQTILLAAAMFGLGCGVRVRSLLKVGLRPFALAALATVLVAGIAFTGVTLVH